MGQSNESKAIREVAENFMKGWYEGDAELMESTMQGDMVSKVVTTRGNYSRLESFSAFELIQLTRNGGGKNVPVDERKMEIDVLDHFQNSATVKILAHDAVEYLHLAKWRGEWKIINILFERYEPTE